MFPKDFLTYLSNNTLIEIKGGLTRSTFLPIWMVEVENRVFARSWNKSQKSWFTEFQNRGIGEIKYGNKVIRVEGSKVNPTHPIHYKISDAYRKKYTQPDNLIYSEGISKPEYFDHTMEFFYPDPAS